MAHLVSDAPLISVMIPSYNYLRYITTAIDSVRAQTYPNVEILVSDNRSTDGTVPALRERYAGDARVRIDENDENVGMIGNFNAAYARSRGDFVLWLSADDWLLPRHLERLAAAFAREPALDVVYSGALFADAEGRVYGMRRQSGQFPVDYFDVRDELVEMLTTTCPLCWPTALFRRALFEELGTFDVDGPTASDWEMQVRFAINGKRFGFLYEPSAVVRFHDSQVTGNEYHLAGANVADFVAIVERYLDHPGMARMRGRETGIARYLESLIESGTKFAGGTSPFSAALLERVRALQTKLTARAQQYEPARAREWRVSTIVVAHGLVQNTIRAIESLAAQTFANHEIVVVDQGTIPLENVLRAHPAWPRIAYLRLPVALPLGAARNLGLRMARGELLAFLDPEHTVLPDHLSSLVDTIARGGYEIAAASTRLVLEKPSPPKFTFAEPLGAAEGVFRGPGDPPELSLVANALPLGALVFYRRLRDTAGPFNEETPILEDFEYLLRLERNGRIGFSGHTTFDAHFALGLSGSSIAAYLPSYLPVLDSIYAVYPAPAVAAERARHRAAVEAFLANAGERVNGPQGLANLVGTLSGRAAMPVPAGR